MTKVCFRIVVVKKMNKPMENPLGFFVLACFPDLWELAVWPHDEQQQSLRAEFYTKINADKFA